MAGARAVTAIFGPPARALRRGGAAARRQLTAAVGGPARTRVVVLLACVLALASADTATVGASAVELRRALHVSDTDIGLLVTATAVVGAVFSLPFGVLADRGRRTWLLGLALLTWGAAMLWSATAGSFGQLLVARLCLGAVTAAAGPVTASLVGDWFPGAERGRIYGFILTGDLLGAGAGFAVTGDIAALSWQAAFVILALPAFVLAWMVLRLPEPARGGRGALRPVPAAGPGPGRPARPGRPPGDAAPPADAHQLARDNGIPPDLGLARRATARMTFTEAVRYVLAVRTNVVLIISSACGYYFLAGVETFGSEFVGGQYRIAQVVANLLLIVVGAGAVAGVLVSGPLSDALLRRGHLNARVVTAAAAATATVLLFIPALVTHSSLTALPYVFFAAAALAAQNPPIDAARLDIMPPWLWGRAEGIRTFLRTAAQALAPVLFGAVSDGIFGGGTSGLRWTFAVMLLPLAASAALLYRAARHYPSDVATVASLLTPAAARRRPEQSLG
ncbi:MAG TPA: MFS transporter [Streptosporangiaceae bacterium]|jgi:MFS family permease|nr:MFS transporter [Streptosporangiaceae bacterium]